MKTHPLLKTPRCCAADLGKPIPDSPHAISVCLPRWQDIIGYEERHPATMQALQLGYPRFLQHPLVAEAQRLFNPDTERAAHLYPTMIVAQRCRTYLQRCDPGQLIDVQPIENTAACLVQFPAGCADTAMAYWKHAGEGISSRHAEHLINRSPLPDAAQAEQNIRRKLAACTGARPRHIYLFPSGMAAIHAAMLAVKVLRPGFPFAQFAFPYGDTLKLLEKWNPIPPRFYPFGNEQDLGQLESDLAETPCAGLFTEFPSNPLLSCVDLDQLRQMADRHGFPLVLDETLGACVNLDTHPFADISTISLTKYFSGVGDVMAGSLILNPGRPFAGKIEQVLQTIHEPTAVCPADLVELDRHARDLEIRIKRINKTALETAEFLQSHPAVEQVLYPALTGRAAYDLHRKENGGYGGVLSFTLRRAAETTIPFYDALQVSKGPNLGTAYSLCCPFVMLAHYNELEWAEAAGVSRWLIRMSAGLEPAEELIGRLECALQDVCKK